jgi:hypothetical protein
LVGQPSAVTAWSLCVSCCVAPRARALPRKEAGRGRCVLALWQLTSCVRCVSRPLFCPPSPQPVRAWAVECRRALPWRGAHRPPPTLLGRQRASRHLNVSPPRYLLGARTVLSPEPATVATPLFPLPPGCGPRSGPHAVLVPVSLRQQPCTVPAYLPVREIVVVEPPRSPILGCRSATPLLAFFPLFMVGFARLLGSSSSCSKRSALCFSSLCARWLELWCSRSFCGTAVSV